MGLVIHHKDRDDSEWWATYDAHETSRVAAGTTNGRLYRTAEDLNDLEAHVIDQAGAPRRRARARHRSHAR